MAQKSDVNSEKILLGIWVQMPLVLLSNAMTFRHYRYIVIVRGVAHTQHDQESLNPLQWDISLCCCALEGPGGHMDFWPNHLPGCVIHLPGHYAGKIALLHICVGERCDTNASLHYQSNVIWIKQQSRRLKVKRESWSQCLWCVGWILRHRTCLKRQNPSMHFKLNINGNHSNNSNNIVFGTNIYTPEDHHI